MGTPSVTPTLANTPMIERSFKMSIDAPAEAEEAITSNRLNPWSYNEQLYKKLNDIERLFRRLKGFRRIFFRLEKLPRRLPLIHSLSARHRSTTSRVNTPEFLNRVFAVNQDPARDAKARHAHLQKTRSTSSHLHESRRSQDFRQCLTLSHI
jgi:hypothetical protein